MAKFENTGLYLLGSRVLSLGAYLSEVRCKWRHLQGTSNKELGGYSQKKDQPFLLPTLVS